MNRTRKPNAPLTWKQTELLRKRSKLKLLQDEVWELTKAIAEECDHQLVEHYLWGHDNGYGKQSTIKGLRCVLCHAKDYWGRGEDFTHAEGDE